MRYFYSHGPEGTEDRIHGLFVAMTVPTMVNSPRLVFIYCICVEVGWFPLVVCPVRLIGQTLRSPSTSGRGTKRL